MGWIMRGQREQSAQGTTLTRGNREVISICIHDFKVLTLPISILTVLALMPRQCPKTFFSLVRNLNQFVIGFEPMRCVVTLPQSVLLGFIHDSRLKVLVKSSE